MKLLTLILCAGFLILWSPVLKAQVQPPNETISNPRVSTSPAYAKDTVTSQNKTVTPNDTVASDPNKPIRGSLVNLSGLLAFPQGDFGINTNNAMGYGFDVSVLINLGAKQSRAEVERRWVNLYAGGNFQYIRQDGTSDSYTSEDQYSTSDITSKVRNNMVGIGAVARVEFFPGKVKLFAEAGAGTRVFSGKHQYEIENTPNGSTDPNDVQKKTTDTQLRTEVIGNYSFGGGIRLSNIELKVLSVKGSKAEYVDMSSIQFDRANQTVSYDTKESKTDMILFQLGATFRF